MWHHKLLVAALAILWLLAPRTGATWSILVVDRATGEVGIGTATCIAGDDLQRWVAVVAVGRGAGATQSQVAPGAEYKQIIFEGLHAGLTPEEILTALKQGDLLKCSRQYGVVDLSLGSASFTGGCALPNKGQRNGSLGSMAWAIQGNVLTGKPVLDQAEAALLATPGRLSDKLMAAMEAARSMGGDGRCSCLTGAPPSCGSPPVGGFQKSAHCGTVIVARIGDTDGPCLSAALGGCAQGDYWLSMNFKGLVQDIDPVLFLGAQYAQFLERLRGHPDGLASHGTWGPPTPLPVGTLLELDLDLRDLENVPLPAGGAHVTLAHAPGSAGLAHRYAVVDHGNGTYTLRIATTGSSGKDLFALVIHDGSRPVTLYPYPEVDYPALATGGRTTGWLQGVAHLHRALQLLLDGEPLAPPPSPPGVRGTAGAPGPPGTPAAASPAAR